MSAEFICDECGRKFDGTDYIYCKDCVEELKNKISKLEDEIFELKDETSKLKNEISELKDEMAMLSHEVTIPKVQ